MSRSYVETFFRHPVLLVAPIVLCFVVGAAFAYVQPRSYTTSATVWTDTSIPDTTSIATTGGPAAGQATLLTQLLATRWFAAEVAMNSPVASDIKDLSQPGLDYALGGIAGSVSVATPGPQVLAISVEMADPEEATGIAASVLEQFGRFQRDKVAERASAQADYDQQRMEDAKAALDEAQQEAQAYLAARPKADVTSDPTASALVAAAALAQQDYAEASADYTRSSSAVAEAQLASLEILDQPDVAYPSSRKKTILMGAGGGLLAGLTLSVGLLLLLVARDRSLRSSDDVVQALDLDVVAEVPYFAVPSRSRRKREVASSARRD